MTRLGKTWCDTCKKDTHDTKDCWGPGTVAYPPSPVYNASPPFFEQIMHGIRAREEAAELASFDQPFCRITS